MTALPLRISTPSVDVPPKKARSLRRFNAAMGLVHLVSGAAMVALSTDFSLPVSVFGLGGPPGTPLEDGTLSGILDVPLAWATAVPVPLRGLPLRHRVAVGLPSLRQRARAGAGTGSGGWSTPCPRP